jgi:5-formyltetrahydrofolate cyclo-ligase
LLYVDARSEVRTRRLLPIARRQGKRTVVPYCVGDRLEVLSLKDVDELTLGTFGILEPKMELRDSPARRVEPAELDLVVVPGVAFDRTGGRLGHGKGYYDRFLRTVRSDATLVGFAFECQLFPSIPMQAHDVPVHKVITEKSVYE